MSKLSFAALTQPKIMMTKDLFQPTATAHRNRSDHFPILIFLYKNNKILFEQ